MSDSNQSQAAVSVVILTLNEEENLPHAIASVKNWASEVIVVDSLSIDGTVEIARQSGCTVVQNKFIDYAQQRNFALSELQIKSEWILFLDADEWVTDGLKAEITQVLSSQPPEDGFYLKWRMIWMGRWIRRGYYPTWVLRLFRRGTAKCEERSVNEHMKVAGKCGYLRHDFIHEDRKGIHNWIVKHNAYATREALDLIAKENARKQEEIDVRLFGTQAQRKRWLRYHVWNLLPPLIRPLFYFSYRYFLSGGFLDGKAAFVYHFMQALWYPMLIDVKYLEMKLRRKGPK